MADKNALTNISDVFIYDATRDPDAGRWTNSAVSQNLSWYTETIDATGASCTIGSDDRCGQANFPKKTILITTADALYIFDADDNTLWMKFTQDGTYTFGADANNNPSSVFALNGVIYVGTNGSSSTGLYAIDFINDRMYRYNTTDRNLGDKNIANRNTAVTYNIQSNTITKFIGAASVQVNDVHGAILSGSSSILTNGGPLNGATYICAATDDGIQVLSLTTQKITPYGDANITDQYSACFITRRARMYGLNVTKQELNRWGNPATSNNNIDTDQIAPATGVTTPYKIWDESATVGNAPNLFATAQTINVKPDTLEVIERGSLADEKADLIYVGHGGGLTEVHDFDTNASPTLGWSKFISTTRETALMTGNQEGMFLLNEAAGATTAADQTVRNSVLAVKGGVTYGVSGVRGTAATFNNSTGFLCSDANNDAACDTDVDFNVAAISFAVHGWFRHSTTAPASGTDTLIDKRYPAAGAALGIGYTVEMNTSGQMIFGIQDTAATAGYDDTVTSTISFADGQWHHFAAVNTDTAICLYIDGKLAVACDTSFTATGTLDASAVMTIGAACGATAACAAPLNFWDGDIDDVYFSGNGATTSSTLSQTQVRKLYLEGRSALSRPSASFVDATTATSTTIGDSTAAWVPNSFVGEMVEINNGTGVGQTRRIISNTSTVLTVSPSFTTPPDTTSDFEVLPEQLYGGTNTVTAIGLTDNTFLGDSRKLYIGTSDGSDAGGVTLFGGNGVTYVTDVFHADAGKTDDSAGAWSGTDYDDVQSIGTNGTSVSMGSLAHMWTETDELDFQVTLDTLANRINSIRNEMVVDGVTGTSVEIGLQGGADLAERYYSHETLQAGEVVAIDASLEAGVKKTSGRYQRDTLGIVATEPAIILGSHADNAYPVALVGRVPVRVTSENGPIYAGDRVTTASRPGYAMRATQAGKTIGQALGDASGWAACEGEDPADIHAFFCTTVTVFVNLSDYSGQPIELAMAERQTVQGADGLTSTSGVDGTEQGIAADSNTSIRLATSIPTKQEQILSFLKEMRNAENGAVFSEISTSRLSASTEVITPTLYADQIFAKTIKADSIEGLQVWTDQIGSLTEKYAHLQGTSSGTPLVATESVSRPLSAVMKNLAMDTLTVQLDGSVFGKLSVAGALRIGGESAFAGNTVFEKITSFFGDTLFKGNVAFEKTPTFNSDTAGFAVIEKGSRKVQVKFDMPYQYQPIVAITLTNEISPLLNEKANADLVGDITAVERDYLEQIFDADMKYIVTEKSPTSFTIILNKAAPVDMHFSWVALAVSKATTSISQKRNDEEDADALLEVSTIESVVSSVDENESESLVVSSNETATLREETSVISSDDLGSLDTP